jgi:hypothetical protein
VVNSFAQERQSAAEEAEDGEDGGQEGVDLSDGESFNAECRHPSKMCLIARPDKHTKSEMERSCGHGEVINFGAPARGPSWILCKPDTGQELRVHDGRDYDRLIADSG